MSGVGGSNAGEADLHGDIASPPESGKFKSVAVMAKLGGADCSYTRVGVVGVLLGGPHV